MTKQMLKGIRVRTNDELATRIYKYFEKINAEPLCTNGADILPYNADKWRILKM